MLQPQKAVDLVEGTGLFVQARRDSQGNLVLVYYDREEGDLKMATGSPGAWQVSFIDGNDPTTDVGQFATAALGSDDSVHVAYVDAINDRLLYKHVAGGSVPMTADVVDDGTRADGPHSVGGGANLALDVNGSPRVVYQDQNTADLEVATDRRRLVAHGSRDRPARLRLLPAPALRRRQALVHRVRLRSAERPERDARDLPGQRQRALIPSISSICR